MSYRKSVDGDYWRVVVEVDDNGIHVGTCPTERDPEEALGVYYDPAQIDDLVLVLLKAKKKYQALVNADD